MDYENLRNLIGKPTLCWSDNDIEIWLRFVHLPQLIPKFSKSIYKLEKLSIDGSCLKDLNDSDLVE